MRQLLYTTGLILGLSSNALADSNDNFIIQKTNATITIDGDLSEWASVPASTSFANHETGAQGTAVVSAKMLWDDNNLYIAFTVTDNDVTANYTTQDDNLFDNDDLVEMFFDFDGSGTNYLELGVSATGVNYDFNIICPGTGGCGSWSSDAAWDILGLETATVVDGTLNNSADTDNGYTVEIKIPLSSLSTMSGGNYSTIQQGSTWKGNLFKINYNTGAGTHAGTDYLSWSLHSAFGFHQPSKFATFTFSGLPVGSYDITNSNISFQTVGLNQFTLNSQEAFSVKVMDILGKTHLTSFNTTNQNINLSALPKGIYFIQTQQNAVKSVKRVVVR